MPPYARRAAYVTRIAGVVLAAMGGAAVLGFSSAPTEPGLVACSGSPVNNVLMSHGRADFGADPHLIGLPRGNGRLCWGAGGAILEGQLYYDDLSRKGCAHIAVEFFNSNTAAQRISLFNQKVCSPGGLRQTSIFTQVSGSTTDRSKRVGRVTIQLFTSETSTGPRTSVGFRGFSN